MLPDPNPANGGRGVVGEGEEAEVMVGETEEAEEKVGESEEEER